MKDLAPIVSHNLSELRKGRGLTQGQLAEKFNYSDKSISKWEHGEALPDLNTLQELADFYGVTLDYLTHVESDISLQDRGKNDPVAERVNKSVIVTLGVTFIWTIAICVLVGCILFQTRWPYWLPLVWAVPLSFCLLSYFNHKWGKAEWSLPLQLVFIWTLVISAYVEIGMDLGMEGWQLWVILLVGVPLTIAQIFYQRIKKTR
jgi:transcriptional regulator with XRE-family HTH domain